MKYVKLPQTIYCVLLSIILLLVSFNCSFPCSLIIAIFANTFAVFAMVEMIKSEIKTLTVSLLLLCIQLLWVVVVINDQLLISKQWAINITRIMTAILLGITFLKRPIR